MGNDNIVTADEAIALIQDGDAVSCSGFVGIGTPEDLITALERRFLKDGGPLDLTMVLPLRRAAGNRAARPDFRQLAGERGGQVSGANNGFYA